MMAAEQRSDDMGSGSLYDLMNSSQALGLSFPEMELSSDDATCATPIPSVPTSVPYAWSLFDDIGDNYGLNVGGPTIKGSSLAQADDSSKKKRGANPASEDLRMPLTSPVCVHNTDVVTEQQDNKRARPLIPYAGQRTVGSAGATIADIAFSAVNFVDMTASPETLRVRGILEARAQAVFAGHFAKNPNSPEDASEGDDANLQLAPTRTVLSIHGYDPLQYFRMITAAINTGCFSDLCTNINRFFTSECSFRSVAVPVGTLTFLLSSRWRLSICRFVSVTRILLSKTRKRVVAMASYPFSEV
jgi:hypothetical protein